MKSKNNQVEPIRELLQQHGTIAPSEGFSKRLMNAVLTSYKLSYSKAYRKEERIGKWIIAGLVACGIIAFVELRPSAIVLEMIIPVIFLIIGVFILIFMLKKLIRLD